MSMGGAEPLAPPIFSGEAFADMPLALLAEIEYHLPQVTDSDKDFS
jgi:hypothetical protein